jgi:hypothetical protein
MVYCCSTHNLHIYPKDECCGGEYLHDGKQAQLQPHVPRTEGTGRTQADTRGTATAATKRDRAAFTRINPHAPSFCKLKKLMLMMQVFTDPSPAIMPWPRWCRPW